MLTVEVTIYRKKEKCGPIELFKDVFGFREEMPCHFSSSL